MNSTFYKLLLYTKVCLVCKSHPCHGNKLDPFGEGNLKVIWAVFGPRLQHSSDRSYKGCSLERTFQEAHTNVIVCSSEEETETHFYLVKCLACHSQCHQ